MKICPYLPKLGFVRTIMVLGSLMALSITTVVRAQSLEGDWVFRGFYASAQGGQGKSYDQNFDSGTFKFANIGGDAYQVTVVDQTETMQFNLNLTRSGNTFSGVIPTETEPNLQVREEVRIFLDGDIAILVSMTWRTSTEAGLTGQAFGLDTVGYVLSRNAFPTQNLADFAGEYSYRLNGQRATFGNAERQTIASVPSISMSVVDGFIQANFQEGAIAFDVVMAPDSLGVGGSTTAALGGVAFSQPGLTINRHELHRYAMAVRLNETDVVWMQSAVGVGTVNTGTTDQYFTLLSASTVGGRATRTEKIAPVFVRDLPAEVAVLDGGDVFLSAEVSGAPTPQYQWYFSATSDMPFFEPILPSDGRFELDFIGNTSLASSPNLVLRDVTPALDGYLFKVEAFNSSGGVSSAPTALKVLAEPTTRLPNLSVRTTLASAQTLRIGFVMTGGTKTLLVRAVGPTLGDFGVDGSMSDPRIAFFGPSGTQLDANDDWSASLGSTFDELGAFPLTAASKDAALTVDLSGLGTVAVEGDAAGTVLVEVYDVGNSNETRLVNVSALNQVGTGNDILIAGFVVTGADPKNMLIRGVGPSLAQYGVTGTLNDPQLKIFTQAGALVATNDNWSLGLRPSFATTGAFDLPDNSLDAALIVTLAPGIYTAQVSGADGGTGQALVEIYELP